MADVLSAAWVGADRPGGAGVHGHCARCGGDTVVADVRSVVSRNFTGWNGWLTPSANGLCAACAWGYQTAELRRRPFLVTREPAGLRFLQTHDLGGLLKAGALHPGSAVIVPLRGRKHLLPSAAWGSICVDDASLPWTVSDSTLLPVLQELRDVGFGSQMLSCAVPPYAVLRRLPAQVQATVIERWTALAPWRQRPLWLRVAVLATSGARARVEP
jgi:hypothetical protein